MMKKGISEVLVRSVMSLYDGVNTRVRVDSELPEKIEAKEGCTKNLCCHVLFLIWW